MISEAMKSSIPSIGGLDARALVGSGRVRGVGFGVRAHT